MKKNIFLVLSLIFPLITFSSCKEKKKTYIDHPNVYNKYEYLVSQGETLYFSDYISYILSNELGETRENDNSKGELKRIYVEGKNLSKFKFEVEPRLWRYYEYPITCLGKFKGEAKIDYVCYEYEYAIVKEKVDVKMTYIDNKEKMSFVDSNEYFKVYCNDAVWKIKNGFYMDAYAPNHAYFCITPLDYKLNLSSSTISINNLEVETGPNIKIKNISSKILDLDYFSEYINNHPDKEDWQTLATFDYNEMSACFFEIEYEPSEFPLYINSRSFKYSNLISCKLIIDIEFEDLNEDLLFKGGTMKIDASIDGIQESFYRPFAYGTTNCYKDFAVFFD